MSTGTSILDELRVLKGELNSTIDDKSGIYARVLQLLERTEEQHHWAGAINALPGPAFIHDSSFRVLHCNRGYAELVGVACKELHGKPYYQIFPKLDGPLPACAAATCGNQDSVEDSEFIHNSGRLYRQRSYPLSTLRKERFGLHILEDITLPRQNEQELLRTKELLECMFNTMHMAVALLDTNFNFLQVNQAYAQADGREPAEFIGLNHFGLYPDAENEMIFRRVRTSGEAFHAYAKPFEYAGNPERGVSYWDWSLLPVKEADGSVSALLLMLQDVTEKTLTQQVRDRLSAIVEATPDMVAMATPEGEALYMNAAGRAMLGLREAEDLSRYKITDFLPPQEHARFHKEIMPALAHSRIWTGEAQLRHRNGNTIPVSQIRIAKFNASNEMEFVGTIARDITREKRSEQRLRRLNRTYAVLSECGQTIVRAETEEELLEEFCRNLIIVGGYRFAWIGKAEQDSERRVKSLSWSGEEQGYLETANIRWDDSSRGRGPVGVAVLTGKPVIVRDIEQDDGFAPWREAAMERGYRSMIAMPLQASDGFSGVLSLYADERDAFDDEETEVILGLADDLSYAIDALRIRAAQTEDRKLLQLRIKAIEAASNGIMITGRDGRQSPLLYVNPAFERITGYRAEEVIGLDPRFLHHKEDEQPGLSQLRLAVQQCRPASVLLRNYRKDGTSFWNELHISPVDCGTGESEHFVGVINDVTAQKHYREQLEYQSTHDTISGLPNRALLHDRLAHGIAQAGRHDRSLAVLLIDLDHFKNINDTFGHAIGDDLLREVAQRLQSCAREADTVAHLGGDEFVMLVSDLDDDNDAALLAERVLSTLAYPFDCVDMDLLLTASMGVAAFPRDGKNSETLLRNASTAMHSAKDKARASFYFYSPEMNNRAHERILLETQLRRALERDEFELYYQPQVALNSGRIVGVEALLRWNNPELGMVSPERFIPIAEESGLIVPIGQWVLYEACRQIVAWQRAGLPPLSIAVNVSAKQLDGHNFVRDVRRVLELTGLESGRLELELTESTVMSDPEEMLQRLNELRQLGLHLAIDDFGIGYSSLSHLQRFPFNRLKVDRSFINDVTSNPNNMSIVKTILGMAQGLNMQVIAEGAENEGQIHLLRRLRCKQVQGFYFSRPLPAVELETLLKERPDFDVVPEEQDDVETLLIVDDEVNVASSLKRIFRKDGYRVLHTSDPTEAFDLLARCRVQVIVADYRMPSISGSDLLDRVKQMHPDIVRILLTGYTDLSAVTSAINRGNIYKFLTKPWENDELRETLREAFEQYHRQKQMPAEEC